MSFRRSNLVAVAPPLARTGNRHWKFPAVNANAQPARAAFDMGFKRFAIDQHGIHVGLNLQYVRGHGPTVDAEAKLPVVPLDFNIASAVSDAQFEFHLWRGSLASCSRRPSAFHRDAESFGAGRAGFVAALRFMCHIPAANTAASSATQSRLDFCGDAAETGAAVRSNNSSSHFV